MTNAVPTQIFRTFDPRTRTLTPQYDRHAGQIGDSNSTVLNFEYPIGWIDGKTPYIVFDLKDDLDNTIYYGPESDVPFDGLRFEIPWQVTHRVKNNRLAYQLVFMKINTQSSGETTEYTGTQTVLSQIDTIKVADVVTQSLIDPLVADPSLDSKFTSQDPAIWGWIEYFKEYGLIVPVTYDGLQSLSFKTYKGAEDLTIALNMPYLDTNGYIAKAFIDPIYQLYSNLVTAWQSTPDDTHYPSEKLVKDGLDLKTDGTLAVWPWDAALVYAVGSPVTRDGHIYLSAVTRNVGHDPATDDVLAPAYWVRVDTALDIVTAWQNVASDIKLPSEKLVKDTLDLKTDGLMAVWAWDAALMYQTGATVTQGGYIYLSAVAANVGHDPASDDVLAPAYWVRVDTALDIVTAWQNVTSDTKLPSEKLVKDSLDLKTDGLMAVWAWDAALTYQTGATVIYNGYEYVSLTDSNLNLEPAANPASWRQMFTTDRIATAWETVLSDGKVPSEKLVRDWFDLYTLGLDGLWAWNATATYKDAAVVTDNYTIYISLADDNTGHDPLEEGSAWWIKVQGGGGGSGGVSVVTRLIGNGTDTAYTVQHGLGTRNFVWSLRRNDNSNAFYTDASVTATTLNTCTVTFRNPPAANAYMLVLVPGGGTLATSGQYTFEQTTAAAVWSIAHNLDKLVTVQTYDGDGNQILGDLKLVDTNNCTVTFTNAHTGTAAVR